MFDIIPTPLNGCFEIIPKTLDDKRGKFVKTLHKETFCLSGLNCDFIEQYYSVSNYGVIRGLHFQIPPDDCSKLVYITSGKVFDVIVDLRKHSSTYLMSHSLNMSSICSSMLYVAPGVAHGFCALEDNSTLVYNVTSLYSPKNDRGVLWSSVDIKWPVSNPIISDRDKKFPSLIDFHSPF